MLDASCACFFTQMGDAEGAAQLKQGVQKVKQLSQMKNPIVVTTTMDMDMVLTMNKIQMDTAMELANNKIQMDMAMVPVLILAIMPVIIFLLATLTTKISQIILVLPLAILKD